MLEMLEGVEINITHIKRAISILHSFMIDQEDLEVTPILAEAEHISILCFFDSRPENINKLKKATNDPSKELQLYVETWSKDEPQNWVLTRYTTEGNPRFENRVFKTIRKSIPDSLHECVHREYYEEAHLLTLLKNTFDL